MQFDFVTVVYLLLLLDSLGAVLTAWFGQKFWLQAAGPLAKYFPPAKGWALWYFVLTLIIGHLLGLF